MIYWAEMFEITLLASWNSGVQLRYYLDTRRSRLASCEVALKVEMAELIHRSCLSQHASLLVGIGQETHETPGRTP